MKRLLSLALALTLALGTTSLGFAGEKPGKGEPHWKKAWEHHLKKFDKNGDGMISKDEIDAVIAAEKAARANQPKEPKTTPTTPPQGQHPHKHHPHVHLHRDFDKIDTNHDGKIDAAEFEAAWKEAAEEARQANEKAEGKTAPAPAPAPAPSGTNK